MHQLTSDAAMILAALRGRGLTGQKTLGQVSDRWFVLFVEAGLVAAAALLLVGA